MSNTEHTFHLHRTKQGYRILNIQIPHYPVSTSSVWLNAGSCLDPNTKQGLSHFFEHLLFIKTKQFPDRQKRLEEVESNGLLYNAFTSIQTQHYFYVHSAQKSKKALELLIDGVNNSLITEKDVETEKEVILSEERENFHDPASYIWRLANKGVWGEKSLGKDFFGNQESIASISLSDIHQFYEDHFTPEKLLFVFINSILSAEEQTLLIENLKLRTKEDSFSQVEKFSKKKIIFENRNIDTIQLCLSFQTLTVFEEEDRITQDLIANYLAGSWTSRLIQRLRIENNFTYWVSPDVAYLEKSGYLRFTLSISPENLQETLKIFENEIVRLQQEGISLKDLEQCQTKITSQILLNSVDYSWLMQWYGYVSLFTDKPLSVEEYCQKIQKLKNEDIQRFSIIYLTKDNFSIAYMGNEELLKSSLTFQ